VRAVSAPLSCAIALALFAATEPAAGQAPTCAGAAECRLQTETAIAQGEFERAHDLGWRTVQQGPRNDRALMFLLARTQALSGRPDDALVMIRRIAELGAAVDASTDEFARMRELPGWPAVEAIITGIASPSPAPPAAAAVVAPVTPAPAPKAPAPKAPAPMAPMAPLAPKAPLAPMAPSAPPAVPPVIDVAGTFTSSTFVPGGLTCDAVSKRFVFGDRLARKLLVLAEGSDHSIDLTRADVAGFLDVAAVDIDTTNGNLWVASAEGEGRTASLHRVQLISGRPLASHAVPETLAPAQPADVAVTALGVLMLDTAQRRILVLRPREDVLSVLAGLGETDPLSLTAGRQDGVAYLSHRDGLTQVDLRTRQVSPVTGPKQMPLGGIERLRRDGAGLVGIQSLPDGSRQLVRLTLNATGRTVTRRRVLDVVLSAGAAPIPMAVCGGTVGLLVSEAINTAERTTTSWTIRRVQLKP
jgi:hypothetical protein